jgi:putative salt-induced outer membrane protein
MMKPSLSLFTFAAAVFLGSTLTGRSEDPAPAEPPKPKWESSAAFGMTLTRGNSETLLATANVLTGYKGVKNELSLGADGAYGEHKDETTGVTTTDANSAHGFVQYNRLFTERFYGYARVDGMFDDIAEIAYRVTLSPGLGYYLIKETNVDLCIEVGPGYIFEKTGSGTNEVTRDYATLRAAEKFHWKISDHARFWETVEWLPEIEDFHNYLINAEVGVEVDMNKKFTLRSYVIDNYDNVPAIGRKNNDLKWITAIGFKF